MGNRAARLAAFAVAAIAVTAAGCRRSPVAAHSADAGGEPTGAPSVSDAAREPLDAGVETPTDASTDADHDLDTSDASDTGDAPPADAPVDQPNTGDGPADLASADGPAEVAGNDAPANGDAPSDRTLGDRSDVRPEDQPCGAQVSTAHRSHATSRVAFANRSVRRTTTASRASVQPVGLCGFREDVACSSDDECLSGHCAQGVCCATVLCGALRVVRLAGFPRNLRRRAARRPGPVRHLRCRRHLQRAGRVRPRDMRRRHRLRRSLPVQRRALRPVQRHMHHDAACAAPAVCIMRNFCTHCGFLDGGTGL